MTICKTFNIKSCSTFSFFKITNICYTVYLIQFILNSSTILFHPFLVTHVQDLKYEKAHFPPFNTTPIKCRVMGIVDDYSQPPIYILIILLHNVRFRNIFLCFVMFFFVSFVLVDYLKGKIFSREDIFSEDIFRGRYFREFKANSRKYLPRNIFKKCVFFKIHVKFSTVEKNITIFFLKTCVLQ